jgi:transposase
MQLTLEQVLALKPLTDDQLATASREELIILIRGEQMLRESATKFLQQGLTQELVLKDQIFEAKNKYYRLRTITFEGRSEKSKNKSYGKKKNTKSQKKAADDTTKLPSERYPNVDIIERVVECVENPQCSCCGETMAPANMYSVSESLSVIPKKFIIIRCKKRKYSCHICKSSIVTTPAPPRIINGSSYADEVIIDVTLNKYCDLVPVERYCRIASMEGVEGLPPNSLISCTHEFADFLYPNYYATRLETLDNRVMQADETSHRMLEGDKKKGWLLWGFSAKNACFFEYHDTRSGDVASAVLVESRCEVLVSDVYSGYKKAVREANILRKDKGNPKTTLNAYCNSHARRGFLESAEAGDKAAQFMIDKYAACQKIENETKTKAAHEVLSIRQLLTPHFDEMKAFALDEREKVSEKSTLAKAYNYFIDNFDGLTYFVNDADTPMDNNQSERLLRSAVIGRKTWYGTHSKRGAKTAGIHQTLIESCKLIDLNPRIYYRESVARHHQKLTPLTPSQMKAELSRRHPVSG